MAKYVRVTSEPGREMRLYLDRRPCICGSTKAFAECCHGKSEEERAHPIEVTPLPPRTGFAHPRCYARDLHDCDHQLTDEHFLPECLTREIADRGTGIIHIYGPEQPYRAVPPKRAFLSKILCERHNRILGLLDAEGCRLIKAIGTSQNAATEYVCASFAGVDVERWLLKVTCGFLVIEGLDVPLEWLQVLFGNAEFLQPAGLEMSVPVGVRTSSEPGGMFSWYRDTPGAEEGAEIELRGLRFTLNFTGRRPLLRPSDTRSMTFRRPSGIWFEHNQKSTFVVKLEWGPRGSCGKGLVVDVRPPSRTA